MTIQDCSDPRRMKPFHIFRRPSLAFPLRVTAMGKIGTVPSTLLRDKDRPTTSIHDNTELSKSSDIQHNPTACRLWGCATRDQAKRKSIWWSRDATNDLIQLWATCRDMRLCVRFSLRPACSSELTLSCNADDTTSDTRDWTAPSFQVDCVLSKVTTERLLDVSWEEFTSLCISAWLGGVQLPGPTPTRPSAALQNITLPSHWIQAAIQRNHFLIPLIRPMKKLLV
jgi:hypothetical protein